MARKRQGMGIVESWQGVGEEDFLRGLVERVLQQVLEAEMTSFLGAGAMSATGSGGAGATGSSRGCGRRGWASWSCWRPRMGRKEQGDPQQHPQPFAQPEGAWGLSFAR